jgi:hypothetical protein
MATWLDGPAYAPVERPVAFAEPASGVSLAPPPAEPAEPVAPAPPAPPPRGFAPPDTAVPLAQLARPVTASRDPKEAFHVVTTTLTQAGSAWGSVHTAGTKAPDFPPPVWSADQPWQSQYAPPPAVNGQFPAPGTMQWFATGPIEPVKQPAVPINVQTLAESIGFPYLIVLGLGLLLAPASFFCLLIAFGVVQSVRFRRRAVRFVLGGAFVFAALLFLFGVLINAYFDFDTCLQVACGAAIVGGVLVQFFALRDGDRPERSY